VTSPRSWSRANALAARVLRLALDRQMASRVRDPVLRLRCISVSTAKTDHSLIEM
jgi:hypothetical protein